MARLSVRLTPRADRTGIDGVSEGIVHARVSAAPVKGAANEALCRLLADALGVPKTSVSIRSGASGRLKTVEIAGIDPEAALARIKRVI